MSGLQSIVFKTIEGAAAKQWIVFELLDGAAKPPIQSSSDFFKSSKQIFS